MIQAIVPEMIHNPQHLPALVDNCQVGVFMGYVSEEDHALLDFRLSLPQE